MRKRFFLVGVLFVSAWMGAVGAQTASSVTGATTSVPSSTITAKQTSTPHPQDNVVFRLLYAPKNTWSQSSKVVAIAYSWSKQNVFAVWKKEVADGREQWNVLTVSGRWVSWPVGNSREQWKAKIVFVKSATVYEAIKELGCLDKEGIKFLATTKIEDFDKQFIRSEQCSVYSFSETEIKHESVLELAEKQLAAASAAPSASASASATPSASASASATPQAPASGATSTTSTLTAVGTWQATTVVLAFTTVFFFGLALFVFRRREPEDVPEPKVDDQIPKPAAGGFRGTKEEVLGALTGYCSRCQKDELKGFQLALQFLELGSKLSFTTALAELGKVFPERSEDDANALVKTGLAQLKRQTPENLPLRLADVLFQNMTQCQDDRQMAGFIANSMPEKAVFDVGRACLQRYIGNHPQRAAGAAELLLQPVQPGADTQGVLLSMARQALTEVSSGQSSCDLNRFNQVSTPLKYAIWCLQQPSQDNPMARLALQLLSTSSSDEASNLAKALGTVCRRAQDLGQLAQVVVRALPEPSDQLNVGLACVTTAAPTFPQGTPESLLMAVAGRALQEASTRQFMPSTPEIAKSGLQESSKQAIWCLLGVKQLDLPTTMARDFLSFGIQLPPANQVRSLAGLAWMMIEHVSATVERLPAPWPEALAFSVIRDSIRDLATGSTTPDQELIKGGRAGIHAAFRAVFLLKVFGYDIVVPQLLTALELSASVWRLAASQMRMDLIVPQFGTAPEDDWQTQPQMDRKLVTLAAEVVRRQAGMTGSSAPWVVYCHWLGWRSRDDSSVIPPEVVLYSPADWMEAR